jgi:hypothetical protein
MLGLAGPFVAFLAIAYDLVKERSRRKYEYAMRLREDRLRAYAALARLTNSVEAYEPLNTAAFGYYPDFPIIPSGCTLPYGGSWANRIGGMGFLCGLRLYGALRGSGPFADC